MIRKLVLAGIVSGVFALGPTLGAAQAQEMHHGGHHSHGYLEFLQGVTLTEAQKTQVHQIMQAGWSQMKPQMEQLRSLHEQLSGDLASTASLNTAQLVALQQKMQSLQAQMDQARLSTALQVHQLLTADQLGQSAAVHAQLSTLRAQEHSVLSAPDSAATAE